ncbi:MAG: hypothetical protein AB9897_03835 [Anaerolineaceae bacterium]
MKKNIQAEDSPSVDNQFKTPAPVTEPEVVSQPNFFKKALPWVIVAVAFLLAGALLIYFTLYRTTNKALTASNENAAALSTQLSASELDLQKTKSDLGTAQAALVEANNTVSKNQQLSLLYKFQADVNLARVGLLKLDPSSARQALSVAGDDLKALVATNISPDTIAGLQPQIEMALTNLEADPAKAMGALDTLYTNLLLISNNIQ